jgi:hypothetical protein
MDDENFFDTVGFGYTQTQPDSPIGEQPTPSTQHDAPTEKGKSNKGKNWSSDEDKVLIAAWANTSLDIVGTDQNRDAYWARISEYYNTHKESSWPERNANAINCRYTLINRETSKFCGCLQQILNRQESGRTIDEKVCDFLVLLYVLCNILYVLCNILYVLCIFYMCCAYLNNILLCADKRCTHFVQGNGS